MGKGTDTGSIKSNKRSSLQCISTERKKDNDDDTTAMAFLGRNVRLRRSRNCSINDAKGDDDNLDGQDNFQDGEEADETSCTYPPYEHRWAETKDIATDGIVFESIASHGGHEDYVQSITFHRGFLFSGSADCSIVVWCMKSHDCVQRLHGHMDTIESMVAFSDVLVSASSDGTIRVWNLKDWKCKHSLQDHVSAVHSLCLLRENKYLASGSWDSTIRVWNTGSWECEAVLNEHAQTVYSIIQWGNSLISGSYDKTIKVWRTEGEPQAWKCSQTLTMSGSVFSLAIWGNFLISGSQDCCVRVWRTDTWTCVDTLLGHLDTVNDLAVIESDKENTSATGDSILVSASGDGKIKFWCNKGRACVKTLMGHEEGVFALAITNESHHVTLATCGGGNAAKIRVWCALRELHN